MEVAIWTLAAGWVSALTGIYWMALLVGGGLLLISLLSSFGDADVSEGLDADLGGDVDLDIGGDVDWESDVSGDVGDHVTAGHTDPGSLTTWLSARFVIYFMASAGMVGVVLTHLSDISAGVTASVAVLAGLVIGQGAHHTFRLIVRTSGNSVVRQSDYVEQPARVTIAVGPNQKGEVALRVRGTERYVPAVSRRSDDQFAVGEAVAVVAYENGVAEVVSRDEFEFLSDGVSGKVEVVGGES